MKAMKTTLTAMAILFCIGTFTTGCSSKCASKCKESGASGKMLDQCLEMCKKAGQ